MPVPTEQLVISSNELPSSSTSHSSSPPLRKGGIVTFHHDTASSSSFSSDSPELNHYDTDISLKSQIIALQTQIKTLMNDHDDQVRTLTDALNKKTAAVESLRTKWSHLEFVQREAIHFLTKPLSATEKLANEPNNPIGPIEIQLVECVRFAIQYLRASHRAVLQSQPVSPIVSANNSPGPLGTALIQATGSSIVTENTTTTDIISSSESSLLSSNRLSTSASTPPVVSLMDTFTDVIDTNTSSSTSFSSVGREKELPMTNSRILNNGNNNNGGGHTRSKSLPAGSYLNLNSLFSSISSSLDKNKNNNNSYPVVDESDLGSGISAISPTLTSSQRCESCRKLRIQLDTHKDQMNILQTQLTNIQRTLDYERVLRSRIQIAKEVLEQEVEDLTAQLFSEANRLVEEEVRRRDALETVNRGLTKQLQQLRDNEIRRTLDRARGVRRLTNTSTTTGGNISGGGEGILVPPSFNTLSIDGPPGSIPLLNNNNTDSSSLLATIYVDAIELNVFQDFVCRLVQLASSSSTSSSSILSSSIINSSSLTASLPTNSFFLSSGTSTPVSNNNNNNKSYSSHSMVFNNTNTTSSITNNVGMIPWTTLETDPLFKRCIIEDIDPCLFARTSHSNSNTAAAALAAAVTGTMSSFRRRLLDGIGMGTIIIEPINTTDNNNLLSGNNNKTKCVVCGHLRTCTYILRFNSSSSSSSSSVVVVGTTTSTTTTTSTSSTTSLRQQSDQSNNIIGNNNNNNNTSISTSTNNTNTTTIKSIKLSSTITNPSDIMTIDRFCRDRILATQDYIMWLRILPGISQGNNTNNIDNLSLSTSLLIKLNQPNNNKPGSHRPPIVELFRIYLYYRRRMAEARIGSMGLFNEGGGTGDIGGLGIGDYANILISN